MLNHTTLKTLVILLISLILGCSSSSSKKSGTWSRSFTTPEGYEVIGQDQQAIDIIQRSPTSFPVSPEDNGKTWARARYFFAQQLGVEPKSTITDLTSPSEGKGNFLYRISRKPSSRGVQYTVVCVPKDRSGGFDERAQLNAKNVARFLREGTLEGSFLAF